MFKSFPQRIPFTQMPTVFSKDCETTTAQKKFPVSPFLADDLARLSCANTLFFHEAGQFALKYRVFAYIRGVAYVQDPLNVETDFNHPVYKRRPELRKS